MAENKIEFIPDKEITLFQKTETENGNDLLNTSTYVEALERCISSAPSDKTFTIGLFGEWGSGKSSIVKTAQDRIEKKNKIEKKNIRFVTYDAWKYAGDSFRRMFLFELKKSLGFKENEYMQRFYSSEVDETEINTTLSGKKIVLSIVYSILAILILICIGLLLGWKVALPSGVAFVGMGFSLYTWMFDNFKVSINKPLLFAPEQFEDCYHDMLKKAMKRHNWVQQKINWVTRGHYNKELSKLIIVVDNIDRCQPDVTYSLLSDIKSFLGDSQDVIFIVPVDVEALRKHIVNTNNRSTHDADEFLRKFFNVSIWIKPFQNDEMYDFTQNLNQKYNLQLSNTSVSVISREFATNPRRIIQLLNNLEIEFTHYDSVFLSNYQSLICLLAIIREEYPKDMKQLVYNPALILDYEEQETKDDTVRVLGKGVCTLLRKTRSVFENLYEQRDVFDKILSNSNVFNGLSQEIESALYSVDMTKLQAFFKNEDEVDQKKLSLLKSCLWDRIKKAVDRGTYFDLSNYVRTTIEFHRASLLVDDDYVIFNNVIHQKDAWEDIVANLISKHSANLADFSVALFDTKLADLKNAIIDNVSRLSLSEGITADSQIKIVLNVCSVYSKKMVTQPLIDQFRKAYHLHPRLAIEQTYKEAYLFFTDKLARDVIDEIKVEDFGFEDTANWQFMQICINKKLQNVALLNEYLKKVTEVMPSYNHDGSQNGTLIQILTDVNNTLEACPSIGLISGDGLKEFLSKYQNVVSIHDRYKGSYTKSLYSDFKDSKENLKEYTKLIKQLGTKYKQDLFFSPELLSFLLTNESVQLETITILCDLANIGSPVERYATSISTYPTVDEKYLSLLSYCFNNPDTNQPRVSDLNWIKARISEIVQLIIKEKDENLARFLDKESASETINNILTLQLSTLELSDLESLPIIRDKAVKTFEEYIDDYKDNFTVLSIIGRCGSKTGVHALVRIIVNKLTDHQEQDAIDLIQTLHYCNKTDRNLIESTFATIDENIIDQETRKSILSKLESIKKNNS